MVCADTPGAEPFGIIHEMKCPAYLLIKRGGLYVGEFAGKRAIITGGSRGIGLAVAKMLREQGAQVLVVARDRARLEQVRDVLSMNEPGLVHIFPVSITGHESVARRIVNQAQEWMGGIDFLVNAAGGATVASALGATWYEWQRDFQTKFWGYLSLMRAVIPFMRAESSGVVVNVVGVAGKDPNPRLAIASAINGALRAAVKNIADEVAPDRIRLLNVHPGATDTDLLWSMAEGYATLRGVSKESVVSEMRMNAPLGRLPGPEDVAALIMFLLSSRASLITGTGIDIDGGAHRGLA